jgi:hypothetical protein
MESRNHTTPWHVKGSIVEPEEIVIAGQQPSSKDVTEAEEHKLLRAVT